MSLLGSLKGGKRNRKEMKFPGTTTPVFMQVLNNAENQEAAFATEKLFEARGIEFNTATAEVYQDELDTQRLFRALKDENGVSAAGSVDELRGILEMGEKDVLITAYNELEEECSPRLEDLSDDRFEEFLAGVKKNTETLNSLNISTLRRLLAYSASRLPSLLTGNGSTS